MTKTKPTYVDVPGSWNDVREPGQVIEGYAPIKPEVRELAYKHKVSAGQIWIELRAAREDGLPARLVPSECAFLMKLLEE